MLYKGSVSTRVLTHSLFYRTIIRIIINTSKITPGYKIRFMNKIYFIIAVFISALILASCKSEKKSHLAEVTEFRNTLTNQDTTQVLKLANDCMELLKKKNIDQAIAMLNEYSDSLHQIQPLSKESERKLRSTFKIFPVLDYELSYYSLQSESVNDVKYNITFAEENNPEKNGKPITSYMFNPVKVDGVWYLCIKRQDQSVDNLRR